MLNYRSRWKKATTRIGAMRKPKFFLCTVARASDHLPSDLEVEREVIAHAHYQPKYCEVSWNWNFAIFRASVNGRIKVSQFFKLRSYQCKCAYSILFRALLNTACDKGSIVLSPLLKSQVKSSQVMFSFRSTQFSTCMGVVYSPFVTDKKEHQLTQLHGHHLNDHT